ncbi:hypothetical protein GXM_01016 [Nostoc sphaeroides CCNUC1]|uniref:Uncharacterized protein n=1 Tax=Nostoc sphaeroides CCNUC1 TaxID=2653204 RepID=A0A5P8VT24_9NOSO|nr:hypothetical protein GXM_01016 [Nostoc sphaeroides CCNUC1]
MSGDKPLTLLLCETLRERRYRFSTRGFANANASTHFLELSQAIAISSLTPFSSVRTMK